MLLLRRGVASDSHLLQEQEVSLARNEKVLLDLVRHVDVVDHRNEKEGLVVVDQSDLTVADVVAFDDPGAVDDIPPVDSYQHPDDDDTDWNRLHAVLLPY